MLGKKLLSIAHDIAHLKNQLLLFWIVDQELEALLPAWIGGLRFGQRLLLLVADGDADVRTWLTHHLLTTLVYDKHVK